MKTLCAIKKVIPVRLLLECFFAEQRFENLASFNFTAFLEDFRFYFLYGWSCHTSIELGILNRLVIRIVLFTTLHVFFFKNLLMNKV